MKRSARVVFVIAFVSVIGISVFQNCSQPGAINVSDPFASEKEAAAARLALGADDETVTVGLNPVPNLKMFFVVDNSGTMQKNQFNLSESFGTMFDPNSSESLSKFDATTVILSTAQKSPSYFIDSDKVMLNKIVDQQKGYTAGMQTPLAQFSSFMRDANYNYGTLPGDNIGYQVSTSASPLKYSFMPAGVLGEVDQGSQVSFNPSIRKLASENSSVMESEFKKRLAILNSNRIPLVKDGAAYKPENASIVDTESGLCAVARILRNPENYFKAGEMVSFTIVSDENDNDPQGLNCVQNITEFTGAEDVVDGECRQRESTISYQTILSSRTADICKINGYSGYNVRFTYPKKSYTTNVTYKVVATAAKYSANYSDIKYSIVNTAAKYSANYSDITYPVIGTAIQYSANYSDVTYPVVNTPVKYSANYFDVTYPIQTAAPTYKAAYTNLSYKVKQYAYQYLQTSVVYYNQSCLDIISDGLVVGQKCTVVTTPVNGIKDGNYAGDCYAFAKSLSANAINTDGYKPVCTTPYKIVGSCDLADANCKQTYTLVDKAVNGLAGSYDAAACLAKAKTYVDYAADTAATCTDASKEVATCSAAEQTTGCTAFKAATYGTKTVSQIIGSFDATSCLNQAKIYSDYAAAGGAPTCKANNKTVTTCSAAETTAGCVKSADATYTTKTVSQVIGAFDVAACLTKASSYSDYVAAGGTPTCKANNKTVTTCSAAETTAGCVKSADATYTTKTVSQVIGAFDAASCLTKASSYSDYVAAGGTPTCKANNKTVSACSAAETTAGCVKSADATYTTKTVSQVIGAFDATSCLAKAKSYTDYVDGIATPVCTANNKTVTACSAAETTAGCTLSTAATYSTKTVSATGDLTTTTDGCFNYAKTLSDSAVSVAGDITGCVKSETTANLTADTTLNFSEVASYDSSTALLTVGSNCGAIQSAALAKVQKTVPQIASTDTCSIVAVNKTTESTENLTTDCTAQANNRCKTQSLGGCVGTLVSGITSTTPSAVTLFKKVNEDIKCASKCSSSALNFCAEDSALDITVSDYIKKKFGNTASCFELTKDIAGTAVPQVAVLAANQQMTCKPNLLGIPSYFAVTKPAYRTKSVEVDYVAGSVKNDQGQSVPKSSLVDFIKERSQSLSNGQMVFSALVRRSPSNTYVGDALGAGGTFGADYEKLINDTKGQIGSVLSNDYSLILKDLSSVLKTAIERTFVMQKMKPNQVIKKVYQMSKKSNMLLEIDKALWTQNGSTIIFSSALDMGDGDQFKIEFANY